MTNLSPELCEKITTSGGELTLECAKCLRSVNRAFNDKVASMILDREMNREQTSNISGWTLNEGAQWMVLVISGILNTEIAADRQGPQLALRAKMSVYAQIYKFDKFLGTYYSEKYYAEKHARRKNKQMQKQAALVKVAFFNTFSRVLMDVCEDKGFNREAMRKTIELAMSRRFSNHAQVLRQIRT